MGSIDRCFPRVHETEWKDCYSQHEWFRKHVCIFLAFLPIFTIQSSSVFRLHIFGRSSGRENSDIVGEFLGFKSDATICYAGKDRFVSVLLSTLAGMFKEVPCMVGQYTGSRAPPQSFDTGQALKGSVCTAACHTDTEWPHEQSLIYVLWG